MIGLPSLCTEQGLIYSGDPALKVIEDADESERLHNLARETGRWSDLIVDGQEPTVFNVKTMTGTAYDWLCREMVNEKLIEPQIAALALRLSLRSVVNLGDYKVKELRGHGFWLTTTEIIDAIYAEAGGHGRAIVMELGAHLFAKAQASPSPK